MTTQVTIIIVAFFALVAVLVHEVVRYLNTPLLEAKRVDIKPARSLIVHTTDSQTVRGIECPPSDGDYLSLRSSVYVSPGGGETSLSGIVHIPNAKVAFCQEITPVLDSDKAAQNGSGESRRRLSAREGDGS